ncbi:hypothetical protein ABGB16_03745 [Micromonospora sp. B11E3]|uniref:hypothetical protein n=1 Tax=Micromonospora sp. B11E3 TaxID=3153562 RepID=UPI00325F8564
MAYRTWGRWLLTALGVSVLAGAGQLGVAYGFGIVQLTGAFTDATVNRWPAQLVWVGWFAASAAVVGAIVTERLARARGVMGTTAGRLGTAGASALGATVVAPLCMQPARAAELNNVDPVWAVAICAILGAVLGAGAALAVLLRPPLGWNAATVACGIWAIALVSSLPALLDTGPLHTVRLGVPEPRWLSADTAQRLSMLVLPLLTLLAGAASGALARWRNHPPIIGGASGAAGPVMIAFAYLAAGPGDTADRYQLAPYYGALIAVFAGALGSTAATLVRWPLIAAESADPAAIEPTDILRPLPTGPVPPIGDGAGAGEGAGAGAGEGAGAGAATVDLAATVDPAAGADLVGSGDPVDAGGTEGRSARRVAATAGDPPPHPAAEPVPAADASPAGQPGHSGADRPTVAATGTTPETAPAHRDWPATADAASAPQEELAAPVARQEATIPGEEGQRAPLPREETAPVPREQVAPALQERTAPALQERATPVQRTESAPVPRNEPAPATRNEPAPATRNESTPVAQLEVAPATRNEATPVAQLEVAPATRDEAAPAAPVESVTPVAPAPRARRARKPKASASATSAPATSGAAVSGPATPEADASHLVTPGADASRPAASGADASGADASHLVTPGADASRPAASGADASHLVTPGADASRPAASGADASGAVTSPAAPGTAGAGPASPADGTSSRGGARGRADKGTADAASSPAGAGVSPVAPDPYPAAPDPYPADVGASPVGPEAHVPGPADAGASVPGPAAGPAGADTRILGPEASPGHANAGHAGTGHAGTGHAGTGHAGTGHADTGHADTGHANAGRAHANGAERKEDGLAEAEAPGAGVTGAGAAAAADPAVGAAGPGTPHGTLPPPAPRHPEAPEPTAPPPVGRPGPPYFEAPSADDMALPAVPQPTWSAAEPVPPYAPTGRTEPEFYDPAPLPRHRAPQPELDRASNWDALASAARQAGPQPVDWTVPAARGPVPPSVGHEPTWTTGFTGGPSGDHRDPGTGSAGGGPVAGVPGGTAEESGGGLSRIRRGLFRRNRARGGDDAGTDHDNRGHELEPLPAQDAEYVDWVAGLGRSNVDQDGGPDGGSRKRRSPGRHHRD